MSDVPPTALNTFDYGFMSNHWMLKAALAYVPPKQLYTAIVAAIDWMIYKNDGDTLDLTDLLDVIAQAAFTGRYVPTTPDAPAWGDSDDSLVDESDPHATIESAPFSPIVDEEAIEKFGEWLSSLPTREDKDRNTTPKEDTHT